MEPHNQWFGSYIELARKVKSIVRSIDPDAKVYVFGSAVRGEATATSDIDVMVVTEITERKYDMMVKVYKDVKEPVELHVVTKDLLERWYKRFIPAEELIEV
ncbi:MAG: nucleotidyltransferase domain-containing protein [Candidatus Freyarchaeota archaeon]|nr:nucleotidyltransferase domain-containing protein [Candidatus Jordarchaeia archaeon]